MGDSAKKTIDLKFFVEALKAEKRAAKDKRVEDVINHTVKEILAHQEKNGALSEAALKSMLLVLAVEIETI